MRRQLSVVALPLLLISASVQAEVHVANPWIRATVSQQKATGAFMDLTATSATRLVAARSPVAAVVEIHEMAMEQDTMRMRRIEGLDLPAGQEVKLAPGGYHVMLMGLKEQVKEGAELPLTLEFRDASGKTETVDVKAPVRPLAGMGHGAMKGH